MTSDRERVARALKAAGQMRLALAGQVSFDTAARGWDDVAEDADAALAALDAPQPSIIGDTICQNCGCENSAWTAPHAVWNRVMGGPEAKDDPGGVLCPSCFIKRAVAAGETPLWLLTPQPIARESAAPQPSDALTDARAIRFRYRNWRGEIAERLAIPLSIRWGATEWHPEPGWLLTAWDVDKAADRDFALADCEFASLAPQPSVAEAARELARCGDVLSMLAQTTGGTAGRDQGLIDGIELYAKAREAFRRALAQGEAQDGL